MDFEKDYYAILGVSQKATAAEIKTAYRKLAKRYHPDLHPDDTTCEEKLKQVNEAWGILGNDDQKFIYDRFFEDKAAKAAEAVNTSEKKRQTTSTGQPFKASKTRQYTSKKWVTHEEKVYVQGEMRFKYRGSQDDLLTTDVLKEIYYRIKITEAEAFIRHDHIIKGETPADFKTATENEQLKLRVPQPVNCTILSPEGNRHYRLELSDLILTKPRIQDVTKDDGDSFGTLITHFYAHISYVSYEEVETTTTEAYGETGRQEYKTEGGICYSRAEYYARDGSTYWGNWIRITPFEPIRSHGILVKNEGCLPTLIGLIRWIFLFMIGLELLIMIPHLWPFVLIGLAFWLISSRALDNLFKTLALIFGLLFLIAFGYTLSHHNRPSPAAVPRDKPREQQVVRKRHSKANTANDSLLVRYREWQDYDGNNFDGAYWISTQAWQKDHIYKQNFSALAGTASELYQQAVSSLAKRDDPQLTGLYHLLDSIQQKRHLTADKFAEMFVSFVQDIPYALVLSKACDASLYNDQSINTYLGRNDARCEPDQRFGINTPVEFLATLYGDCDTRTLLAFTVLRHYGYSVALLSSQTYSHSLMGVELPYTGTAYETTGHRYTLWETTAPAPPGVLADEISNLDYWNITLTSQP